MECVQIICNNDNIIWLCLFSLQSLEYDKNFIVIFILLLHACVVGIYKVVLTEKIMIQCSHFRYIFVALTYRFG